MEFTEIQIKILFELSDMESYSNKQLTKLLGMQKTNMSRSLGELEEHGVILRGEPRKSIEGKKYTEIPYYISFKHPVESRKELHFFEIIVKRFIDIDDEASILKLLKSNYVNKLIEKYSFMSLIDILERYIKYENFNKIISKFLSDWPVFINEIGSYPNIIKERAEFIDSPIIVLNLYENNLISFLRNLNPIEAIYFYRNIVSDTYSKLLGDLEGDYNPDSFKKMIDIDIHLSPFTSYPVNDPIRLLFTRPFERLYDDVYLIDESDYERFIRRAFLFYSHFIEILSDKMRYLIWEKTDLLDYKIRELERLEDTTDLDYWDERNDEAKKNYFDKMESLNNNERSLDTLLKISILYWNITSSRIDSLCRKLDFERKLNESSKFHIYDDGRVLKIVDLETNDCIINTNESKEIMGTYFLLDVLLDNCADPFTYLRPCDVFEKIGLKAEIKTYEELLEEFSSKFDLHC